MNRYGIRSGFTAQMAALAILGQLMFGGHFSSTTQSDLQQVSGEKQLEFAVPPPPFTEGMFPCSDCHADLETNPQPRILEDFHDDIVFEHDEENRWCLACHDADNRDMLQIAGGELIDYQESYKLCGQCHGPKLRDWKAGIHGRRTGSWNGRKEYLLCAHCHNPHSPRFPKMMPAPPPVKPGEIK